ncbi:hypothetical protein [Spongiivirga citrea]|uniref:Uncharacterized protein n=1 Tax=Spongiivirga citrea TaxID=1481457 RepID=A0A6M0CS33_9FLAO|nr:hypothetical protein [Spongiivirga citrea]NER18709.1 hypothetical protein [Spongiivirga citrea]
MNSISSIIQSLTNEEKRLFVNSLHQKNKRIDTKNIELFKLLDKNISDAIIKEKLYQKQSNGAYHALTKRLSDSLIDFLASRSFESETAEEMNILKLLLASRILFERKQLKVAFKSINKAEKLAIENELYNILNEIYHTSIQYAYLNPKTDLETLTKKLSENGKKYVKQQQLNIAYAQIKLHLDKTKLDKSPLEIINSILLKYDITPNNGLDFKSTYQLMEICNTTAKIHYNYFEILPTMRFLYSHIELQQEKTEKHLFYHIKALFIMANTLFRNKYFGESNAFLKTLETELSKKKAIYKSRFISQLTLLQGLNGNYLGDSEKAILLIKETIKTAKKQKRLQYDARLSLVMCYFQQEDYSQAFRELNFLNHSNGYFEKKMGREWVVKKDIIELLLVIELDDIDLVTSRFNSFRKSHRAYLKNTNETRTLQFVSLAGEYYRNHKKASTGTFKEKVEQSFEWIGVEQEDLFVMSFYAWLKSKMVKTGLYATTLELVVRTNV